MSLEPPDAVTGLRGQYLAHYGLPLGGHLLLHGLLTADGIFLQHLLCLQLLEALLPELFEFVIFIHGDHPRVHSPHQYLPISGLSLTSSSKTSWAEASRSFCPAGVSSRPFFSVFLRRPLDSS